MLKNFFKKILFSPPIARQIVRLLGKVHQLSYAYLGSFACAAEGGLHPKHRLIRYHQFFVSHVVEGDRILEGGCGNGALLQDVAKKSKALTVGVEIDMKNAAAAKSRTEKLANVKIVHEDIWKFDEKAKFNIIILSNTLEHLKQRSELLCLLKERFDPEKFLIRVPMFEREWPVPYKKELGIEWRLDPTHETEYTKNELREELSKAELAISSLDTRWGEFYVVAVPVK